MLTIKSFPVQESDAANDYIKENYPRGEHGVTLHNGHIVIFHESGEPFSKEEAIASLTMQLGQIKEQYLHARIDEAFWEASAQEKTGAKDRQQQTEEQLLIARGNTKQLKKRLAIISSMLNEAKDYDSDSEKE